jgi:TRAP-type C4-dicarboxylate transport system permease small subunit
LTKTFFATCGFLDRLIQSLARLALNVAACLVIALAVLGTADVLATNLLLTPVPGAVELSRALLAGVIFLALANAQRTHAHVKVDILAERLPPHWQRYLRTLGLGLGVVVFALLTWGTGSDALESTQIGEVDLGYFAFPVYPAKIAAFLGCLISLLEFSRQLVRAVIEISAQRQGRIV